MDEPHARQQEKCFRYSKAASIVLRHHALHVVDAHVLWQVFETDMNTNDIYNHSTAHIPTKEGKSKREQKPTSGGPSIPLVPPISPLRRSSAAGSKKQQETSPGSWENKPSEPGDKPGQLGDTPGGWETRPDCCARSRTQRRPPPARISNLRRCAPRRNP